MTWLRSKVKLDRCEIVSRSVISTSGHNIQVKLLVEADKFETKNIHWRLRREIEYSIDAKGDLEHYIFEVYSSLDGSFEGGYVWIGKEKTFLDRPFWLDVSKHKIPVPEVAEWEKVSNEEYQEMAVFALWRCLDFLLEDITKEKMYELIFVASLLQKVEKLIEVEGEKQLEVRHFSKL